MSEIIPLIAIVLFAVLMVFIGIRSSKKSTNMSEFLLGSRNIGPWMSAFAYGTSYFSAVIFIGYAGKTGWGIGIGGIWLGIGNAIFGSLLAWLILAKRTRAMTHELGAKTMPEFFGARYKSKPIKIFSALIVFIFLLPYAASVYMGLGYLFNTVFPGVDYVYCMLLIACLTAVYLVLGGYKATVLTDFIQGIIMIFGVVVMIFAILNANQVGGLSEGLNKLKAIEPDLTNLSGGKNWLSLISLIGLTSFGAWGLPQMVHKFYAVKDEKSIKIATVVSTLFALIIGVGAYFFGTFGRLILNNELPKDTAGNVVWDKIIPEVLKIVFSGDSTAILITIILLLVLSASMSTLSAVILTSSSAVVVDIAEEIKPDMSKKTQMLMMRGMCLVFVALSFLFASMQISFIISLMAFSWGVVSGCFIGPYIWGLFWKKTSKIGAWVGMLSGIITVFGLVIWKSLEVDFKAAQALSPNFGCIAMIVSFLIVPLVTVIETMVRSKKNNV